MGNLITLIGWVSIGSAFASGLLWLRAALLRVPIEEIGSGLGNARRRGHKYRRPSRPRSGE